jgi:predicted transposase/invertase (TIGR01784 family)
MDRYGEEEQIRLDLEEAREKAIAEGRAEGIEKGHAEGHAEEKLEIARNLKKMGLSISQIAEGTGLSPDAIERL